MNSFLMLTFTFTFSINWVFSEFLYESRRLNLILDFQLAEITGREDTLNKKFHSWRYYLTKPVSIHIFKWQLKLGPIKNLFNFVYFISVRLFSLSQYN
jgi:hypothetical protein